MPEIIKGFKRFLAKNLLEYGKLSALKRVGEICSDFDYNLVQIKMKN
jgi:hypothetical protein